MNDAQENLKHIWNKELKRQLVKTFNNLRKFIAMQIEMFCLQQIVVRMLTA